jgi:hypothetical protein
MTRVSGKSGNPKGRPANRIKKATQEVIAQTTGMDLSPSEMAVRILRRLFDIGFDPTNPAPVQLQAFAAALPYLAPRMQVVAATVRHTGSYDDCRTKAELFARVEQDLGAYWAQLFRKAVQSDDSGSVIEAEVVESTTAAEPQVDLKPGEVEPAGS